MRGDESAVSVENLRSELRRARLHLSFREGSESRIRELLNNVLRGLDQQLSISDPEFCLDSLTECLHHLVPFDEMQLMLFRDSIWEQVYTSTGELEGVALSHGALTKRLALGQEPAVLYSPMDFPEFSGISPPQRRFYASALLMSCTVQDSIYLLIFSSSSLLKMDLQSKRLFRRFRSLIVNAVQRFHVNSGLSNEIIEVASSFHHHLDKVKHFIEAANLSFWRTDPEGYFIRDPELEEDFRISAHLRNLSDALIGLKLTELTSFYELSGDLKKLARVQNPREVFQERRNLYKFFTALPCMGQDFYVCINGEPLYTASGEFDGYIGVLYDISIEIRLMQTLENAKKYSEETSRSKTQFLAMMSHEIKTPMQAIVGILDLLRLTELTPEQKDLIQHITHSANLLQTLLKDVLDYSRMGSSEMKLEELSFSVRFVMDSIIRQMTPKAREQGIELKLEVADNFPGFIVGDQNRLSQVLFNLLGNAIKFTQYGEVKLKASVLKSKNLRFEVSDTGIGIPKDKQKILFSPFRQVDASMTRRFGGTGLGLAICRRIIDLMNGTIGVDSVLGKGSTFWFVIPCRLPSRDAGLISARSVVKSAQEEAAAASFRILLAEDSKVNQFIIKKMLENLGHSVILADNGRIAVELVEKQEPDLVLMDLQMPEMNGIDAARRIMRYHPQLVILALTANATPEERTECRNVGMLDIVSKPVTMETLKSMFQTFGSAIRRSMAEKAAAASVQEHGRDGAGDEGREQIQESGQEDEAPEDEAPEDD